MSNYYSNSRRRREKKQQEEVLNLFIVAGILACFVVLFFVSGIFSRTSPLIGWFTHKQHSEQEDKTTGSTALIMPQPDPLAESIPAGYKKLNPKCKPERSGIVNQLQEVLQTAREMESSTPSYIREKVEAMLGDIDTGKICVYSEQTLPVITRGTKMAMGKKDLVIYLQSLDPDSETYRKEILIGITHERLHYEDNLPSTLENYVNGEVAVRKRVCDNGVLPWTALEKGYIPFDGECHHYRINEQEWASGLIKRYTADWNRFERYVK